jgi:hypothetical protein
MGEEKKVHTVLVENTEGKITFGRQKCKEDEIRMDMREIGCGSVEWIQSAQDRERWRALVNTATSLPVLKKRLHDVSGQIPVYQPDSRLPQNADFTRPP